MTIDSKTNITTDVTSFADKKANLELLVGKVNSVVQNLNNSQTEIEDFDNALEVFVNDPSYFNVV